MVTIDDVEQLSSKGWSTALDDTQKQAMLDDAEAEVSTIYSDDVATLPSIEGDVDVFTKNLAAHKWELAEGGEAASESNTGGNVNYNLGTPDDMYTYLSQTRFGRTCIGHLGGRSGIGIVRTY